MTTPTPRKPRVTPRTHPSFGDGPAPKPLSPEEMIEALKRMGYEVDLPTFPPHIEEMARTLVELVLDSPMTGDQLWRSVAAKLNENNWRPQGRSMESGEQGDHYEIRPTRTVQHAPTAQPGFRDGEVVVAPVAPQPFSIDVDPSQMR